MPLKPEKIATSFRANREILREFQARLKKQDLEMGLIIESWMKLFIAGELELPSQDTQPEVESPDRANALQTSYEKPTGDERNIIHFAYAPGSSFPDYSELRSLLLEDRTNYDRIEQA